MTTNPPGQMAEEANAEAPSRARHVLGLIRQEGPAEPFRRFLYRRGVYRRLALGIGPLLRQRERRRPLPADMVPSWFEPSEIDEYLAFRPDQDRAEIEARLEAGHVGMIVRKEGRVVGHSWLGRGRVPLDYLDCTMTMAPDVCQYYDEFVAPELRRQGVLRTVSQMRRRYQQENGLHWRVMTFLPENVAAFTRIGRFRPIFVGEIGRIGLGPVQRLFLRLDRELTSAGDIPISFAEAGGRPARVRRVEGPLGLERAFWARRESAPAPPLSGWLDRAGVHRRRLVTVFGSDTGAQGRFRVDVAAARLEPGDLDAYLELRPDQDRAEIEGRWRTGHVCFVARGYGRIVAASWLAPGGGTFRDLGCEVRLAPDAAGVYDDFVQPSLRRMHALNPVAELRSQHALNEGWKRCVALVPPEVKGAWLRMQRNGRPVAGELTCTGAGPFRRWGLRVQPGARPDALPCRIVAQDREVPRRS